jgi:hypothetical protein
MLQRMADPWLHLLITRLSPSADPNVPKTVTRRLVDGVYGIWHDKSERQALATIGLGLEALRLEVVPYGGEWRVTVRRLDHETARPGEVLGSAVFRWRRPPPSLPPRPQRGPHW